MLPHPADFAVVVVVSLQACVNEAIDQLLAEESKQGGHEQQQQQGQGATASPGSPWLVAVIVPITVVAGQWRALMVVFWWHGVAGTPAGWGKPDAVRTP